MEWLGISSFLLTLLIAWEQWITNEKQRRQFLYDKRYDFYNKLLSIYIGIPNKDKGARYITMEDIAPLLSEAQWLFGDDMRAAINNLIAEEPDDDNLTFQWLPVELERVFRRYMSIESINSYYLIMNGIRIFIALLVFLVLGIFVKVCMDIL